MKDWGQGQWNAWVEMGQTKKERGTRLNSVPEEYRARVEDHVRFVFKLRKRRA